MDDIVLVVILWVNALVTYLILDAICDILKAILTILSYILIPVFITRDVMDIVWVNVLKMEASLVTTVLVDRNCVKVLKTSLIPDTTAFVDKDWVKVLRMEVSLDDTVLAVMD